VHRPEKAAPSERSSIAHVPASDDVIAATAQSDEPTSRLSGKARESASAAAAPSAAPASKASAGHRFEDRTSASATRSACCRRICAPRLIGV
jgi:hypothetical protein